MRLARLVTALAAATLLCVAGQAWSQPKTPVPSSTDDRLMTPQEDTSQSVSTVAQLPLNDLNLVRQKIPIILLTAVNDPYAPLDRLNCKTIAAEVGRLYVALGRDYDDPQPPKDRTVKGMTRPGGDGLKIIHSAAQIFIPYDGFVRTLSGAQKHDEHVMEAISAGNARRAYLKGLGESRNCPAPAAPHGHGREDLARAQFW